MQCHSPPDEEIFCSQNMPPKAPIRGYFHFAATQGLEIIRFSQVSRYNTRLQNKQIFRPELLKQGKVFELSKVLFLR